MHCHLLTGIDAKGIMRLSANGITIFAETVELDTFLTGSAASIFFSMHCACCAGHGVCVCCGGHGVSVLWRPWHVHALEAMACACSRGHGHGVCVPWRPWHVCVLCRPWHVRAMAAMWHVRAVAAMVCAWLHRSVVAAMVCNCLCCGGHGMCVLWRPWQTGRGVCCGIHGMCVL